MLNILLRKLHQKGINADQSGFTLIETVIGIALLSIITAAVLTGMSTAFKADAVANKQSTAMSMALNQVESLQLQTYQVAPDNSEVIYAKVEEISNYTVWSYNRAGTLVANVIGVPWSSSTVGLEENPTTGSAADVDEGLQRINMVIKQGNEIAVTLEIYKVE